MSCMSRSIRLTYYVCPLGMLDIPLTKCGFYAGGEKQCREAAAISMPVLVSRGIGKAVHFDATLIVNGTDGRENICLRP